MNGNKQITAHWNQLQLVAYPFQVIVISPSFCWMLLFLAVDMLSKLPVLSEWLGNTPQKAIYWNEYMTTTQINAHWNQYITQTLKPINDKQITTHWNQHLIINCTLKPMHDTKQITECWNIFLQTNHQPASLLRFQQNLLASMMFFKSVDKPDSAFSCEISAPRDLRNPLNSSVWWK